VGLGAGRTSVGDQHEFLVAQVPRLRAFAHRQLARYGIPSGRLQADDVVNYTIAELLERWYQVHEPHRYMFTVARRFIWRAAREAGRFTGAPTTTGATDDANDLDQVDPDRVIWSSARQAQPADVALGNIAVGEMYARLSPQQRQAVHLIEVVGASRAETAAAMGVKIGTVSQHRNRGLMKLGKLSASGWFLAAYVLFLLGVPAGLVWLAMRLLHRDASTKTFTALPHWVSIALAVAPMALVLLRLVRDQLAYRALRVTAVVRSSAGAKYTIRVSDVRRVSIGDNSCMVNGTTWSAEPPSEPGGPPHSEGR
jgi:RNA polymerase sigma factor (sigma-70 family)